MENAHLRLGRLEFCRFSTNISTHIKVRVDRFMGEKESCQLLSCFGGDAEIGAISAAVSENSRFELHFPNGESRNITMRETAVCYRGGLSLPGRKHALRHLVAVSQAVVQNGSAGKTYMVNYHPDLAWNILVSTLGIPATPEWGPWILALLERKKRIQYLDGIGCEPVRFNITREELLKWIEDGVSSGYLPFPTKNGPIIWPAFSIRTLLTNSVPNEEAEAVAA